MPIVFTRHKVADYAAWRPKYDADVARRKQAGLCDLALYRDASDPNMVLMMWEADGLDGLKAMLSSPDLKALMKEAGVISQPEAWVGEALGR